METMTRSIGIFGVQQGVGVTTLSIAMARYCSQRLKDHTALVELSGNHELEELQRQRCSGGRHAAREHYFANARCESMAEIAGCGCGYQVLDLGSEFYRIRSEFLRCDRKVIVVSLVPWKRKELDYFMSAVYREEKMGDGVMFLAQFGKKEDKKDFQKTYGVPVFTFPYLEDALRLTNADVEFLCKLI